MSGWVDEELRRELHAELEARSLEVVDDEPWFVWLSERFPAGLNRIAWWKVPVKETMLIELRAGLTDFEHKQLLSRAKPTVERWLLAHGVDHARHIVWVGDSTEYGLRMDVGTFLGCFERLFSFPQHAYVVIPGTTEYCLNYVMEGDLFFGAAGQLAQPGSSPARVTAEGPQAYLGRSSRR